MLSLVFYDCDVKLLLAVHVFDGDRRGGEESFCLCFLLCRDVCNYLKLLVWVSGYYSDSCRGLYSFHSVSVRNNNAFDVLDDVSAR